MEGGIGLGELFLDLRLDVNQFYEDLAGFQENLGANGFLGLRVGIEVDDRPLTALNQHIELKRSHLKSVQDWMKSNPLKPVIDDSSFTETRQQIESLKGELESLGRNADVSVNITRNIQTVEEPTTVRRANTQPTDIGAAVDTDGLEKSISGAFEKAFKQVKSSGGGIGGAISNTLSAPFKLLGSVAREATSGLVLGATQEITKDLGKGISQGLERELSPIIGSSKLLGQEMAGALTKELINGLIDEVPVVERILQDLIGKQKIATEAAATRGQQAKDSASTQQQAREQIGKEVEFIQDNRPAIAAQIAANQSQGQELERKKSVLQNRIAAEARKMGVGRFEEQQTGLTQQRETLTGALEPASKRLTRTSGLRMTAETTQRGVDEQIGSIQERGAKFGGLLPDEEKQLATLQRRRNRLQVGIERLSQRETGNRADVSQIYQEIDRVAKSYKNLDREIEIVNQEAGKKFSKLSDLLEEAFVQFKIKNRQLEQMLSPVETMEVMQNVDRSQAVGKLAKTIGPKGSNLQGQVGQTQKEVLGKLINLKDAGEINPAQLQLAVSQLDRASSLRPFAEKLRTAKILPVEEIAGLQQELEAQVVQQIAQMQSDFAAIERFVEGKRAKAKALAAAEAAAAIAPAATNAVSVPVEKVKTQVEKPVVSAIAPTVAPVVADTAKAKALDEYTKPQLLAAARKLGLEGVSTKTNKPELITQIARKGRDQFEPVLTEVETTTGRDGSIVGGADTAKEKALLKNYAAAEKKINADLVKLATLEGKKREALLAKLVNNINQLNAEIAQAKKEPLTGETVQAVSGIQGRLRNTAQTNPVLQQYKADQTATVQAAAQSARQRQTQGLARVSPEAAVATAAIAQAEQPIRGISQALNGALQRVANFAAKQFDVKPQPTVRGTLGAIARSEKGRAQIADLAVNTAGFAASQLGAQFGPVAGLAGDLGGALVARQAINVGTAGVSAYKSLNKTTAFQQARRLQQVRMLAQVATVNMAAQSRQTGADLTGDLAGFTIGNLAASGLTAMGVKVPLQGAVAALATVPRVVAARERFLNQSEKPASPAGLARTVDAVAATQIKPGIFGQLTQRFRSILPSSEKDAARVQANYQKIFEQVSKLSKVAFDPAQVPKLEVNAGKLKQLGAQAFFDIEKNLILIDDEIASILKKKPQQLLRYKEQLKALTHESRHSVQTDGGKLGLEEAATGQNVSLLGKDRLTASQRRAVEQSVSVASRSAGGMTQPMTSAVRSLETDAYAFEAKTPEILQGAAAKPSLFQRASNQVRSLFGMSSPRPLSAAASSADADFELMQAKEEAFSPGANRDAQRNLRRNRRTQETFSSATEKSDKAQQRIRDNLQKVSDVEGTTKNLEAANLNGTSAAKGVGQVNETVDRLQRLLKSVGIPVDKFSFSLEGLGRMALRSVAGFVGFQILQTALPMLQKFGAESLEAAMKLDTLQTSLTFASGSKNAGAENLAFLNKTVDDLKIPLEGASDGFRQLTASTRATSIEGEGTRELFKGIGQAATVLDLSSENTSGSILALSQMMSKGKVQAEELRGQLGERIPGAFAIAARAMGVTEGELNKMLETGQVLSDDFMPKFAKQLQSEFGGAAVSASGNARSALNQYENSWLRLQQSVGKSIQPAQVAFFNTVSGALGFVANNAEKLIQIATLLAVTVGLQLTGAFTASIGGMFSFAGGGAFVTAALTAIRAAIQALLPMLARFLLMAAAIEGMKAIFGAFSTDDLGKGFDDLGKRGVDNLKKIADAADIAAGKVNKVQPKDKPQLASKGFDLTLGFGEALGVSLKTDDVIKGVRDMPGIKQFQEGITNISGGRIQAGSTQAEKNFNDNLIKAGSIAQVNNDLAGQTFEGDIEGQMASVKAKDDALKVLQLEKQRLQGQPIQDKKAIADVDARIKSTTADKNKELAPVLALQAGINDQLAATKQAIADIDKAGYPTEDAKQMKAQLEASLVPLEKAKEHMDKLNASTNNVIDPTRKLLVAFEEMATALEEVQRSAEKAFSVSKKNIAEKENKDFGTDQFGSLTAASSNAEAERTKNQSLVQGTESALSEAQKTIEDPGVQQVLSSVTTTSGKPIDENSSVADLENAKKRLGEKDSAKKDAIDKLKLFKESKDKLVDSKTALSESELGVKKAKQSEVLGKLDEGAADRQATNKVAENAMRMKSANPDEIAVKSSEMALSAAKEQMGALQAEYDKGTVGAEEFSKRKRALTVELSNAELQVFEAGTKKLINEMQRQIQKLEAGVKLKETTGKMAARSALLNPNAREFTRAQVGREESIIEAGSMTERLGIKDKEMQQNAELVRTGKRSKVEGDEVQQKLTQEKADLQAGILEKRIQLTAELQQATETAEKAITDAAIAAIDAQKSQLDILGQNLDRLDKFSKAMADLTKSKFEVQSAQSGAQMARFDAADSLFGKLKDENLDPALKAQVEGRLGGMGVAVDSTSPTGIAQSEFAMLQQKQQVEDQIAQQKANALAAEMQTERQSLEIEIQKNKIAAQNTLLQTQGAKLQAEQNALIAQRNGLDASSAKLKALDAAANAKSPLERELAQKSFQIASQQEIAAGASVEAAQKQAVSADAQIKSAEQGVAAVDQLADLQRETLDNQQQAKSTQFNSDEFTRKNAQFLASINAQQNISQAGKAAGTNLTGAIGGGGGGATSGGGSPPSNQTGENTFSTTQANRFGSTSTVYSTGLGLTAQSLGGDPSQGPSREELEKKRLFGANAGLTAEQMEKQRLMGSPTSGAATIPQAPSIPSASPVIPPIDFSPLSGAIAQLSTSIMSLAEKASAPKTLTVVSQQPAADAGKIWGDLAAQRVNNAKL